MLVALAAPLAWHAWEARQESRAAEPHPLPATDAEQAAIVAAALHEVTRLPPDLRRMVLDTTMPLCDRDSESPLPGTECPADHFVAPVSLAVDVLEDVPRKWRQELVLANRQTRALGDPGVERVDLASADVIDRLFAADVGTGWEGFRRTHPHIDGFNRFSIAVLSPDRRQALIAESHSCGELCGWGGLVLLEKRGDAWQVVSSRVLWLS
jgi:hypothetical protein